MKIIKDWRRVNFDKIIDLYGAVNWTNYTKDPVSLETAFENSTLTFLALSDSGNLMGLTRSITDHVSIHYLQDIIVHPEFQRQGVGRELLEMTLDELKDVRTHMILTDDEEKQIRFYESLGFKNPQDLKKFKLNTFIKMKGIDLI